MEVAIASRFGRYCLLISPGNLVESVSRLEHRQLAGRKHRSEDFRPAEPPDLYAIAEQGIFTSIPWQNFQKPHHFVLQN